MFFLIYQTTNKINGNIYIGKHMTDNIDDGYIGSGKLLRRAIEKYGRENFDYQIIFHCDNEANMNAKERELVTEVFCDRDDTYNICPGGKGGFGYINRNDLAHPPAQREAARQLAYVNHQKINTPEYYQQKIEALKIGTTIRKAKFPHGTFIDRTHTEYTKEKVRNSDYHTTRHGANNSQFGTMWITNGKINKKIPKLNQIPIGFHKGRKLILFP